MPLVASHQATPGLRSARLYPRSQRTSSNSSAHDDGGSSASIYHFTTDELAAAFLFDAVSMSGCGLRPQVAAHTVVHSKGVHISSRMPTTASAASAARMPSAFRSVRSRNMPGAHRPSTPPYATANSACVPPSTLTSATGPRLRAWWVAGRAARIVARAPLGPWRPAQLVAWRPGAKCLRRPTPWANACAFQPIGRLPSSIHRIAIKAKPIPIHCHIVGCSPKKRQSKARTPAEFTKRNKTTAMPKVK